MPSKFKYQPRSDETVRARANQTGGGFDSYLNNKANFLKVKEGENVLRIMPPTWDTKGPFGDNWAIDIWVHRDIGPDKGVYLCLDKMNKGKCPLCEARHDVDPDDEALLKALKPQRQLLAYVINRDAEKEGPVVWRLGWQLEKEIQLRSQDKKTGAVLNIDDPDNGYDISFRRDGQGLKTRYSGEEVMRDETPLHEKQSKQDAWMEFIIDNPLPSLLNFYDAEYLEAIYRGKKSAKADNDEEADDRPTRSSRRPAKDEDEEQDERPRRRAAKEEDEPEERPRRSSRREEPEEEDERPRRRAAKDDDEEMPNDREMARNSRRAKDEEEEEEPKPRRRKDEDEDEDERPRRRAAKDDDEGEEEPEEDTKTQAKKSLTRLQGKK